VRITTRFNERDLRQSLFAMIHEAGHALYEMGLPDEHVDTPLGQSVSLAVHESQSRFFENTLGRSLAFWTYFYPDLKAAFPTQLGGVPLLKFYEAVNIVAPSLIRVEADEVTYNLHIVLRFEIERAFMAGEVAVADLPDLWRAKVKQYLDIDAPNDADGVLQDVHWSEGLIGYFPTYTMGNLYGAQLREKIMADLGDIGVLCARGEFAPILNWMREHVHRLGKRYTANELIERATGKKPTAEPFMRYLAEKYGPLYHL
jgi:carboxypeptidase Taq